MKQSKQRNSFFLCRGKTGNQEHIQLTYSLYLLLQPVYRRDTVDSKKIATAIQNVTLNLKHVKIDAADEMY